MPGGCEGQTGQGTVARQTVEYELMEETKTISNKVTRRKGPKEIGRLNIHSFLCFNCKLKQTNTFELRVEGRYR
jgi:hypothetical protein